MKVWISVYNMKGKASIWWQDLKISHGLKKKNMKWAEFKKHYLSEIYYKKKTKEFYELKLSLMTMEDLINKFLYFLRFVLYIKEEKVKVQRFLSFFKGHIEFDNPKTLDEVQRKEKLCFEQYK